jgi:hypothetical protein
MNEYLIRLLTGENISLRADGLFREELRDDSLLRAKRADEDVAVFRYAGLIGYEKIDRHHIVTPRPISPATFHEQIRDGFSSIRNALNMIGTRADVDMMREASKRLQDAFSLLELAVSKL